LLFGSVNLPTKRTETQNTSFITTTKSIGQSILQICNNVKQKHRNVAVIFRTASKPQHLFNHTLRI